MILDSSYEDARVRIRVAALEKVGPHGFSHGWVFHGVPGSADHSNTLRWMASDLRNENWSIGSVVASEKIENAADSMDKGNIHDVKKSLEEAHDLISSDKYIPRRGHQMLRALDDHIALMQKTIDARHDPKYVSDLEAGLGKPVSLPTDAELEADMGMNDTKFVSELTDDELEAELARRHAATKFFRHDEARNDRGEWTDRNGVTLSQHRAKIEDFKKRIRAGDSSAIGDMEKYTGTIDPKAAKKLADEADASLNRELESKMSQLDNDVFFGTYDATRSKIASDLLAVRLAKSKPTMIIVEGEGDTDHDGDGLFDADGDGDGAVVKLPDKAEKFGLGWQHEIRGVHGRWAFSGETGSPEHADFLSRTIRGEFVQSKSVPEVLAAADSMRKGFPYKATEHLDNAVQIAQSEPAGLDQKKLITGLKAHADAMRQVASVRTDEEHIKDLEEALDKPAVPTQHVTDPETAAKLRHMANELDSHQVDEWAGSGTVQPLRDAADHLEAGEYQKAADLLNQHADVMNQWFNWQGHAKKVRKIARQIQKEGANHPDYGRIAELESEPEPDYADLAAKGSNPYIQKVGPHGYVHGWIKVGPGESNEGAKLDGHEVAGDLGDGKGVVVGRYHHATRSVDSYDTGKTHPVIAVSDRDETGFHGDVAMSHLPQGVKDRIMTYDRAISSGSNPHSPGVRVFPGRQTPYDAMSATIRTQKAQEMQYDAYEIAKKQINDALLARLLEPAPVNKDWTIWNEERRAGEAPGSMHGSSTAHHSWTSAEGGANSPGASFHGKKVIGHTAQGNDVRGVYDHNSKQVLDKYGGRHDVTHVHADTDEPKKLPAGSGGGEGFR